MEEENRYQPQEYLKQYKKNYFQAFQSAAALYFVEQKYWCIDKRERETMGCIPAVLFKL